MSGFISFLFGTFIFVITFAFVIGHLFGGTYHGYLMAFYWGIASFVAAGIAIFSGYYYFVLGPAKIAALTPPFPRERPYVFIKRATLREPLTHGQKPVLTLSIANSGPLEATGELKDVTFSFTIDLKANVFTYHKGDKISFRLAPTADATLHAPMEFVPTEQQVTDLIAETARLFFYGRGKYKDEYGRTYPLDFCFRFDPNTGEEFEYL